MIRWISVAIWMGVIFAFSSQAHSSEVTKQYFGEANILIRKIGHVSEYLVLYSLVRWAAAPSTMASAIKKFWLPFIWSVAYAGTDEFHQSFVPGRSAAFSDVLVDAGGAALAAILFWSVSLSQARRRKVTDSS
jgi:VanZ family protein